MGFVAMVRTLLLLALVDQLWESFELKMNLIVFTSDVNVNDNHFYIPDCYENNEMNA